MQHWNEHIEANTAVLYKQLKMTNQSLIEERQKLDKFKREIPMERLVEWRRTLYGLETTGV